MTPSNRAPKPAADAGLPELSVVVPTFNERDNVTVLFRRLAATLAGIAWEVVFVDDNSPDGTWEVVRDWRGRIPGSAASAGSGGAAFRVRVSRAFWLRAGPMRL